MRRARWRRWSGILLYVVGVLLCFESLARLTLSSSWFLNEAERPYDAYWRLRWIGRHPEVAGVAYGFDIYHRTRGWALKPNVHDMPAFGSRTVNSNSKGLRGNAEHAYEKPAGRTRIVVLGDSFTFGEEVSDDETYSSYLQQALPGTEVLNLGVHGYGHDQMLIYLREEGMRYHPDIVLVGFVGADMTRNLLQFRDFAKPRFFLADHGLVLSDSPVPTPEQILGAEFWRPHLLEMSAILYQSWQWRRGAMHQHVEALTRAILGEMLQTIDAAGATPVFVYLPVRSEVGSERTDPSRRRSIPTRLLPRARRPLPVVAPGVCDRWGRLRPPFPPSTLQRQGASLRGGRGPRALARARARACRESRRPRPMT